MEEETTINYICYNHQWLWRKWFVAKIMIFSSNPSDVSDVASGHFDSQGYRWKKSPPKTDAPPFSEKTTLTTNFNPNIYNPAQPDELIQTEPFLNGQKPDQYESLQPTPVLSQESEKPLFPNQTPEEDQPLMIEKPLYETKPVDLEPVNELVSDLNHLLDGLKENTHDDKNKLEKPEKCVLKKNLESCDIYLCSMIRSMLAVPFPDCYAVKSYYRKLDM